MSRAPRPLTLIVSLIVGFALLTGCVAPAAPAPAGAGGNSAARPSRLPQPPAPTQAPAASPMDDLIAGRQGRGHP